MQGRPVLGIGLSLLLATGVWAAGPDEDYVRVYRKIVEADSLREAGQYEPASRIYLTAQESLERLQRANPGWNERLVTYRLTYIANQLKVTSGSTAKSSPQAPAAPTPATAAAVQAITSSPAPTTAPQVQTVQPDPQVLQIQQENQNLRATAARLEAKLKEALSVQPAPADPKDLAKVQDQLKELARENELLKANLVEEQRKMKSIIVTNTVERTVTNTLLSVVTNKPAADSPELGDLRKNLTNQVNAVTALQTENEVLKKELSAAKATPPPVPAANLETEKKLQESLRDLAAMQAANQALLKKQTEVEKNFNESKQTQASQEEKLKRLEALEKDLSQSRADSQRLTEQNQALQKRLADSVSAKGFDGDSSRRILKLEKDLLESQSEVRLLSRQKGDLQQKIATVQSAKAAAPEGGAPLQITPGAGGEAASVEVHRQLKQATWEVLNLQAQNQDLLKKQTALEQQLVKSTGSKSTFDSIDADRIQRLEKMNLELADARKSAMRLEQENQEMARQLVSARQTAATPPPAPAPPKAAPDDSARKIQEAQTQLRLAEEANKELQRKAGLLEQQLADAKSSLTKAPAIAPVVTAPAPKLNPRLEQDLAEAKEAARKLQQENRDLEKKLALAENAATSRRGSSKSTSTAPSSKNLERELAMLKARLDAIQAKAVPYTEEELSLFSRLEVNIASGNSTTPTPSSSSRSGGTVATATEVPSTANAVADARKDFDSGRFAEAERKFQDILKSDDKNVYLLAHLAAAQFEQGKFSDADRTTQQALSVTPEDAPSLYMLGIIRLRQDKLDEAIDALSRAAQASPQNATTQNSLGVALSQKGLREPAETAFRKALQLRPDFSDAHYNLAVEYVLQQPPSYKLAAWHYQKSITAGHAKNPELEKRLEAAAANAAKAGAQ